MDANRSGRSAHILVADSDAAHRRLLVCVLRSLGYRVTVAQSASELRALLCLHAAIGPRIDLVLAFAELQDMQPLHAAVPRWTATPPLVLMGSKLSGWMKRRLAQLRACRCVHRPIYVDELRQAVQETLAERPVTDRVGDRLDRPAVGETPLHCAAPLLA